MESHARTLDQLTTAVAIFDRAKQLHKDVHSGESESVLLDAYAARIQALLQQNLTREAASLMDLVSERFPGARARLQAPQPCSAAQG